MSTTLTADELEVLEYNARHAARKEYYELIDELDNIAAALGGMYLTDELIDRENVLDATEIVDGSSEFWLAMTRAAGIAAGMRAEELGVSLNKAAGRVIY